MPYAGLDPSLIDKVDQCVEKVMGQGHDKSSAIGICRASIEKGSTPEQIAETFTLKDGVVEILGELKLGTPEHMSVSERIAIEEFMASNFKKPFRIIPIGKYYRGDRVLDITPQVAQEMYSNWKNKLPRYGLNITVEHSSDPNQPGAIGRVTELGLHPDGVYAESVEFSKAGEKLLDEDRYRAVSPEIIWSKNNNSLYQDPQSGKYFDNVICGLSITQTPFFGGDVQVFSAKAKIQIEKFEGGAAMKEEDMTPEQKKKMDKMMADGMSKAEAIKELDKEDELETASVEDKPEVLDKGGKMANIEEFNELKNKAEAFAAELQVAKVEHAKLTEQFNAERHLRRTVEFVEAAEKFSALPTPQEDLGKQLLWMYDADITEKKDHYSYFEKVLEAVNGITSQSEVFKQMGTERNDEEGKNPFLAEVEKVRKENFATKPYEVGFAESFRIVENTRKDLAAAYAETLHQ